VGQNSEWGRNARGRGSLPDSECEGHMALLINLPRRIPGDLPGMIVGIRNIATKATVRRSIGRSKDTTTCCLQALHKRSDIVLG